MIRVIGDLHGCVKQCRYDPYDDNVRAEQRSYVDIIKGIEYSVQLGDVSWREAYDDMKEVADPNYHKVIMGNHDDYEFPLPHSLGDFGYTTHGGITFGFIRGERSIDWERRLVREMAGYPKSWWKEEEFTHEQANQCIEYFEKLGNVDIMLAHGCPHTLFDKGIITNRMKLQPSFQSQILSAVREVCKVNTWIFGHHHNNWRMNVDGTNYICLNELCYLDIEDDGTIGETK
jgi:predicted phosphodiesterase